MMRQACFLHRRHTGHKVYTHRHMQTHRFILMYSNIWASCRLCSQQATQAPRPTLGQTEAPCDLLKSARGGAGVLHLDTLLRAALEEKGWPACSSAPGHTTFLFFFNIYFWLHWVFAAMRAFSSCGAQASVITAPRFEYSLYGCGAQA